MIIGIDPDVDKNGVAVKISHVYSVYKLSLIDTFNFILERKNALKCVYIECGYLSKKINWHTTRKSEYAAHCVGRNAEIARQLVKFCKEKKIPYKECRPTGIGKNYTREQASRIFGVGVTNADQRDALFLLVGR